MPLAAENPCLALGLQAIFTSNDTPLGECRLEEVKTYLCQDPRGEYVFNLHLLYPEHFAADDPQGYKTYDAMWMWENLGSRYSPSIEQMEDHGAACRLKFESPTHACIELLAALHRATNWTMLGEYEADFNEFRGIVKCAEGRVFDSVDFTEA